MKFRYLVLSVLFFSSFSYSFSRGDGGPFGGGLDISAVMFIYTSPSTDVYIYDAKTGLEIEIVPIEELDSVTADLESGEYILIYTDSDGNMIEQSSFIKE